MGSLSGSSYENALVLFIALVIFGVIILFHARELNAFAIGEENARHIGVNVKRVVIIMIAVSGLIGVCIHWWDNWFCWLSCTPLGAYAYRTKPQRLIPTSLFGGQFFLCLQTL